MARPSVRGPDALKIAALVRVSGVARSTIRHYLNLGLLPPPRVCGPKLHLYGPEHLARLRAVAQLADRGLSLEQIRRRLGPATATEQPRPRARARPPRATAAEPARGDDRREALLDAAARRFLERGYEGVRVDEVARDVGMSKATFYQYFASKADLFVECLDHLRYAVIGRDARTAVERPLPLREESALRARAVLASFGPYRMMTGLLASAACGADAALARRARQALHRMVTNAEPMFRRAIDAGECRAVDTELLAYMTWGALLAVGDRLALDGRYSLDEAARAYLDFVVNGIRPRSRAPRGGRSSPRRAG
jgi:AcrR family transcriptional regulator